MILSTRRSRFLDRGLQGDENSVRSEGQLAGQPADVKRNGVQGDGRNGLTGFGMAAFEAGRPRRRRLLRLKRLAMRSPIKMRRQPIQNAPRKMLPDL